MSPLINAVGGSHPGGDLAPTRRLKVKAGEAIAAGKVCSWSTVADDGITVVISGANTVVAGVALEAIASGSYGYIQTRGLNEVFMTLATGDSTAGHYLYVGAAGEIVSTAMGSLTDADFVLSAVGLCLTVSSSSVQAAGTVVLFPFGGF